MKLNQLVTITSAFVFGAAMPALAVCELPSAASRLGVASAFNVFVTGDIHQSATQVEGRIAAGGDARFKNYSVGQRLTSAESPYALMVGGDLTFEHGSIFNGHVVVGGKIKMFSHWDVFFLHNLYQGKPLDFSAETKRLRDYSSRVAAFKTNGKAEWKVENTAYALSSQDESAMFVLDGDQLSKSTMLSLETRDTASVVVTITGKHITLKDFGFKVRGARAENTIFHFPEAETLTMYRLGVPGSILAPNAAVDFTEGNVQGNLIAASLKGNGHMRLPAFAGCLP